MRETFNEVLFLLSIFLMQALIVSPLTSISQAPQLPVKQPVGISKPAFFALENQSSPSETYVSVLFDHIILIFVSFKLILMQCLSVSQIHAQVY